MTALLATGEPPNGAPAAAIRDRHIVTGDLTSHDKSPSLGSPLKDRNRVDSKRWIVSQIGAREHYAVGRVFASHRQLDTLYTDVWCPRFRTLLKKGPSVVRAMAGRFHPGLAGEHVVSFSASTIIADVRHRLRKDTASGSFDEYLRAGSAFARQVKDHLASQTLEKSRHRFFGFFTGSLETLEYLRPKGIFSVVDQADAGKVHYDAVHAEVQKWPGWQSLPETLPVAYYDRLQREWELANVVLVNSEWSRNALLAQGVPSDKIIIVPLAYEQHGPPATPLPVPQGTLTILWVGGVNLGKGIQYLIEAARLLADEDVRFVVAGQLLVAQEKIDAAPSNITFLGRVTRDRVDDLYRNAHLFVIPTLSDGFALTQVEAMARGLPVIATPNCARVVTPGVNGLIVRAGDGAALADAIRQLNAARDRFPEMSRKAIEESKRYTLENYYQTLTTQVDAIEARTM